MLYLPHLDTLPRGLKIAHEVGHYLSPRGTRNFRDMAVDHLSSVAHHEVSVVPQIL